MRLPGVRALCAAAVAASVMACFGLAASNVPHGAFFSVEKRQPVSFDYMMGRARAANVIFVGEEHGNAVHQDVAMMILQALREMGKPAALGLEMFTAESQPELDRWVGGDSDAGEFRAVFRKTWDFPWDGYSRLFYFARQRGLPMVGLNVPRQITRKVAEQGFDSLTQEELKALPEGLSCDVSEQYREYIRRVYRVHDKSERNFEHFCEAQMVWDSAMAFYIDQYLRAHPGTTVVVLAGSRHSWKHGIPEQVRRRFDGITYKVLVPENVADLPGGITTEDADFLMPSRLF